MLDWFASFLEICKMVCIAKKKKTGFVIGFMSCVAWLIYVIITNSTHGILLVILPAMALNVWGYYEWSKFGSNVTRCECLDEDKVVKICGTRCDGK